MKLHKIRNVPLDVCCAEQKIAYNIAFRLHINRGDEYMSLPEEERPHAINRLVEEGIENYRNAYTYTPGKYNEEAIETFLKGGLARYLEKRYIATNYDTIGNTFRI